MKRPLRIAIGRVFHEANVYSPIPSTLDDFHRMQYVTGDAVLALTRLRQWELPGLIPAAELSGFAWAARRWADVELVPLLSAFAVPSGKLTSGAYEQLRDTLLARLRSAGRLDGVYLALHGSMRVEGMSGSPEADLLESVGREAPGALVAATLDLHANLSQRIVDAAPVLQSFRANPHWDLFPSGARAGHTLVRSLRGDARPVSAWRKLPVVLGGGAGISFLDPARRVFRKMKQMHRQPGVLNTSFNMVHPFSDAPDLGWSVHVTVDDDQARAEDLADTLAETAWGIRRVPIPEAVTVTEAMRRVRGRRGIHRRFPSSLVDMGDGVLTGATGGSTYVLGELVRTPPDLRVLIPLHDPALVAEASARVGQDVEVVARGTPGLVQEPVRLSGRVRRVVTSAECGRLVHLDLGDVQLVASEQPPLSAHPRFYEEVGIEPRRFDAILQKSFFHYRLLYLGTSHHHVPVATPGPSDLHRATHRPFPSPVFPAKDPPTWRPFDAAQRGLARP